MKPALALPLLLLAAAAARAQETPQEPAKPEPGPVPPGIVHIGKLHVNPTKGEGKEALATFLAGHGKQKQGDVDGALRDYLAFLGMPGRHDLPRRYLATVRARVKAIREEAAKEYAAAADLYRRDRTQGVAALEKLAARYPLLPEGRAARALWHTDRLRAAIDAARPHAKDDGKKREAAAALEKAVRTYTSGLYLYEAKRLLVDLGGPDLFEPGEEVGDKPKEAEGGEPDGGEEPTIEVGDG